MEVNIKSSFIPYLTKRRVLTRWSGPSVMENPNSITKTKHSFTIYANALRLVMNLVPAMNNLKYLEEGIILLISSLHNSSNPIFVAFIFLMCKNPLNYFLTEKKTCIKSLCLMTSGGFCQRKGEVRDRS